MTDIMKFQLLLNSINTPETKFTVYYCKDISGWKANKPGDNTVQDYIAMEIDERSDIHIMFDKYGKFQRFTHHG